ncbi:MAG: hypothetical protein GXO93_03265 [FCB group bacterium]|nr:hypothetical protein [FCB group bacterium]
MKVLPVKTPARHSREDGKLSLASCLRRNDKKGRKRNHISRGWQMPSFL